MTSHSLLDTPCTAKEGWMVACLTLSGSIGVEEIPSPKRFPGESWLPRSEKGRNNCSGHGSSELCCPIYNAPGSAFWSSPGALSMSCPPHWGRWSPGHGDIEFCRKGLCGSCSCICPHLPLPQILEEGEQVIQIHEESHASQPEEVAHLKEWLDLYGADIPQYHWDLPHSHTNQTHADLARVYPKSATRSPLPGATAGKYPPWPGG